MLDYCLAHPCLDFLQVKFVTNMSVVYANWKINKFPRCLNTHSSPKRIMNPIKSVSNIPAKRTIYMWTPTHTYIPNKNSSAFVNKSTLWKNHLERRRYISIIGNSLFISFKIEWTIHTPIQWALPLKVISITTRITGASGISAGRQKYLKLSNIFEIPCLIQRTSAPSDVIFLSLISFCYLCITCTIYCP